MDFVLERLSTQTRIVLECGKSYTCGRGAENAIICRNLQVSRKHCIFLLTAEKLFITDLKSANGSFVNGKAQESYKMVQLFPNDIVGIGCPDMDPNDNTLFVYKVCITKTSDPSEVADTSDLSSTIAICDTFKSQSNSHQDCVSGEEHKISPIANNCNLKMSETSSYILSGPSTSTSISNDENKNNINKEIIPDAENKSNINEEIIPDAENKNNINEEIISDAAVQGSIRQEDDVEIIHTTFPEANKWDIENSILKYETYLKKEKMIKSERLTDDEMDIDKDNKNNSENSKSVNNVHTTRKNTNSRDKINSTLHSNESRFVQYDDKVIKYEDDLQLTDEDEEALLAASKSNATGYRNCQIVQEKRLFTKLTRSMVSKVKNEIL